MNALHYAVLACIGLLLSACSRGNESTVGPEEVSLPEAPVLRVSQIGDGEIRLVWEAVASEGDVIYVVCATSKGLRPRL